MDLILQPCDWVEYDANGSYRIDVFGRTSAGKVACLQILNFKPYFYVGGSKQPITGPISERVKAAPTLVRNTKYDVFAGFQELKPIQVWRATCPSLSVFYAARSAWADRPLYESNLPPFLRLFHDRHLGPASPIACTKATLLDEIPETEDGEPVYTVDEVWQADYRDITAHETTIPLLVGCYDLEMYSESGKFPQAERGDPIIQLGISYRWSTNMLKPVGRVVFVVGTVDEPEEEDVTYISCATEKELLQEFIREVTVENNPDVLCGYNTFGFDDAYLEVRAQKLGVPFDLSRKIPGYRDKAFETKKFELASGKYDLRYMTIRGRLGLDLLLNMRREHSLDSFKLDSVASVFLRDRVLGVEGSVIQTKSTRGLSVGNYVRFDVVGNTTDPYREGEKFIVTEVTPKAFRIRAETDLFTDLTEKERKSLEWTFSKDDVEPQDLFRMHKGTPSDRATIAKYCLQDCDLVLTLMAKLDTLVNARGMADVCKVPMDYVLRRGQGIKIFSAVLYYASQRDQILRVQEAFEGDTGYEGAIVLPPKIGMYLDQPVSVLDFNSLYPSNMIAYNLSPDTLVSMRVYNEEGQLTSSEGYAKAEFSRLEEAGYVLDEVEYDVPGGKTVCTYIQTTADQMTVGILPKTLDILLKKRKEFKEKMEDTQYDEAQRSVFNGLQLAYKVVANSVYGQTGSRTSPIRKLCVAACTTAAGRKALFTAKRIAESEYGAEVVYGDTDSIFIKFPTKDLAESIRLGMDAGKRITAEINRRPYKIAYEKTFYPFILFCRKRYVGMMYEDDPTIKPKRKSMGIVLKRRDNAPIVKDVFGGALDVLMQERNVKKAQAFVTEMLIKVLENKVPLEKFIVTKALRDDYKNPDQIAHRVLADRMAARDPGTAPKVGDRIAYVYVAENKTATKQGDKIEEVGYARKKGLHPDTQFYITNQIQNPVAQLFALCLEDLEGYTPPRKPSYGTLMEEMLKKHDNDEEEATLAVLEKKEKQLETLMFLGSPPLQKLLRKNRSGPLDAFFGKKA